MTRRAGPRRGTELPCTLWGRRVKPLAAGLAAGAAALAWVNATGQGALDGTGWAHAVAAIAAATALVLVAGWATASQRAAEWGLVLAVGLWTGRGLSIGLLTGWAVGATEWWTSLLNAAVAAGALALEVTSPGPRAAR